MFDKITLSTLIGWGASCGVAIILVMVWMVTNHAGTPHSGAVSFEVYNQHLSQESEYRRELREDIKSLRGLMRSNQSEITSELRAIRQQQ